MCGSHIGEDCALGAVVCLMDPVQQSSLQEPLHSLVHTTPGMPWPFTLKNCRCLSSSSFSPSGDGARAGRQLHSQLHLHSEQEPWWVNSAAPGVLFQPPQSNTLESPSIFSSSLLIDI
jgi:hypothetical protein